MSYISYNDWENLQKEYAPNNVGQGEWQCLHDNYYFSWIERKMVCGNYKEYGVNSHYNLMDSYPIKFLGEEEVSFYEYSNKDSRGFIDGISYRQLIRDKYYKSMRYNNHGAGKDEKIWINRMILPIFYILKNDDLAPNQSRLTIQEKSKIILEFFIEQDWIPIFESFEFQDEKSCFNFKHFEKYTDEDFEKHIASIQEECDKYNRIFDAYYQKLQLQKQLVTLEQQIAELPEPQPEPKNTFTSNFDYRQELKKYNLTEINHSILQYSVSAQQWLNHLLAQIDHYENSYQHLLDHAAEINKTVAKKLPSSLKLDKQEQEILTTHHSFLQQHLNFSLESLKLSLVEFLQQNKQTEITLKNPNSLMALAELEKQTRPSFTLLAEYSANLYNQAIQKLDWLEKSLNFVQAIIKSEQQSNLDYVILLDKYHQDLIQTGLDNSIEAEKVEKWFVEWREKRLQILQQWQPLVEAGLTGVITEQTVLDTLQCLAQYQQQIDMFYVSERLGIYTTYAFAPNGHRQEEMAKELELININHAFMRNLEKVIFAAEITIEQKVWLVHFGEVWQQGTTQEIIKFLKNEGVFNRSDIAQIISEGERDIQQQNLAACLQDMKSYAQALGQREKTTNTLIYKMRKALEK